MKVTAIQLEYVDSVSIEKVLLEYNKKCRDRNIINVQIVKYDGSGIPLAVMYIFEREE